MQNPPPEPPRRNANLFERLDYLVKAALFLIAEGLNTRHQTEQHMTQTEQLVAEVAELKSNVATAATEIASEIADLAAAHANQGQPDPAVEAVIADLRATNAKLRELSGTLSADNAPTPPPAG